MNESDHHLSPPLTRSSATSSSSSTKASLRETLSDKQPNRKSRAQVGEWSETDLVGLAVSVLSQETGLLELVVELLHSLLILLAPVLQHLAHTANISQFWWGCFFLKRNEVPVGLIGGLGGLLELLLGGGGTLLGTLKILLNLLDFPVEGGELALSLGGNF